MDILKPITLDVLDTAAPALSSTSDMPVIETKPDASPAAPVEADKAAPAPDPEEGKTPVESATTETPEEPSASPEAAKPAKGVQKRLDELTKQREEANRRAEAATEGLNKALSALEKLTGKPAEDKPVVTDEDAEPAEPSKANFNDLDEYDAAVRGYTRAFAAWTAKREVKAARAEDERARTEKAIRDEMSKVQTAFSDRLVKVKEKYADFKEVAETPNVTVPGLVAQAIIHAEDGPELQYFFGKNPEEAKRLFTLDPYNQLVALGKISAKLAGEEPAKPAENGAPAPAVSAAPKPPAPIRTSGTSEVKTGDELSMEEYAAQRRKAEGWADPLKPKGRVMRH